MKSPKKTVCLRWLATYQRRHQVILSKPYRRTHSRFTSWKMRALIHNSKPTTLSLRIWARIRSCPQRSPIQCRTYRQRLVRKLDNLVDHIKSISTSSLSRAVVDRDIHPVQLLRISEVRHPPTTIDPLHAMPTVLDPRVAGHGRVTRRSARVETAAPEVSMVAVIARTADLRCPPSKCLATV